MYEYRRPIRITHQASLSVPLGRGRSQFTANHLGRELYALYALKKRLCMLCEDTTPKKTAYNAYRNANRRVRRAESTKMYAVGNAYRLHTKCIQAHKRRKRERILLLTSFLYCLFLSSTVCDFRHSSLYCLRFRACTDPIKPHCSFFWVGVAIVLGRIADRQFNGLKGCMQHACDTSVREYANPR